MHDIRKPSTRSRSSPRANRVLDARVEAFEKGQYPNEEVVGRPRQTRSEVRSHRDLPIYPKKDAQTRVVRKKNSLEKLIFALFGFGIVGFIGLYTYVFNSATVTLTPKFADVAISKIAHFGTSADDIAFILATTTLSKTRVLPQTESKKVQTKAEGRIIIYNNFDAEPQRLLKNTRFESSDGKIYRINTSITVPGKKGATPGSLEVTVYADSYGESYNIPPSDFTVPGFKGTPRYQGFFARSVGPISGGAQGDKKLVSASDLSAAKDELALSMANDVKNELKKITKDGYIALATTTKVIFDDNSKDVLSGITAEYAVTGTGYLVLAKESDVAKAVAKGQSQYNDEPLRLDYQNLLTMSLKEDTDISKETEFDVLLDGKPRIVWVVDQDKIKQSLSGKSKDDFTSVLNSFPAVQKAEMKVSPFWLTSFPDALSKIEVIEKLPKLSN